MSQTRIHLNTDYVNKEMKRRGIKSINELARQIGISESMMNLMMREKRYPGRKAISLMKSYFNVNFETLFVEVLTKVHKSA